MKKVLALLLSFVMTVPSGLGVLANQGGEVYSETVVRLSDSATIMSAGLKSSTQYTRSGIFTASLSGSEFDKNITMPVSTNDFSEGKYLEFYLYSTEKTASAKFLLAFYSDNKNTSKKDCFYTTINANFDGWKHVSISFSSFLKEGEPQGFDKIDNITLMPSTFGSKGDAATVLYFDDFVITSQPSENANAIEPATVHNAVKLVDVSAGAIGGAVPAEKDGIPCLLWKGKENLEKPIQFTNADHKVDFSKYGEIKFKIYSEKATNNPVNVVLTSENPDTTGWDYYKSGFSIDWAGEWREITLSLGSSKMSSFGKGTRTPLGFDKIDSFEISLQGWDAPFYPDTEIYICDVVLDGEPKVDVEYEGDYILEDQYDPESMTDYIGMIKEKHPDKSHPRLILTEEKIAEINKYKDTDPFLIKLYDDLIKAADAYLKTPLTKSGTHDGTRLDWTPSTLIPTTAMAYVFTKDEKYKQRTWEEIKNICDFPNWNQTHFLDCAEYCRGIAFAYDWLYDEWTKEEKRIMRNAVMDLAYVGAVKQLRQGFGSWLTQRSNWIEVGASGMGLCALAFGDEKGYEAICNEILNRTLEQLPEKGLYMFAPDGNYSEGTAYWNYALYTLYLLTNSMHTSLGTDAGIEDYPGLDKTGFFPFGVIGPQGGFNYSDASKNTLYHGVAVNHYIAGRYNIPQLAAYSIKNVDTTDYRDILWYNPEAEKMSDYSEGLPLDYFASGLEPLGSARSGYDKNAYFIAFKGGNNGAGHDQLDIGSFVLDANGERWVEELGAETYYKTDKDGCYYRHRAEGNNTFVINPDGDLNDQLPGANKAEPVICDYTHKGTSEGAAFGVFDVGKVYPELLKAERGFALINNRTQFIIQDELTASTPSTYYSFFHTRKANKIEVSADGKSAVITAPSGKKCRVDLVSSESTARLSTMEAVHLAPSPKPANNDGADNSDYHKLFVYATDITEARIAVVYTPLLDNTDNVSVPKIKSFDKWDEYLVAASPVKAILVDGVPIEKFSPGIGAYIIPCEKVGTVSALTADGATVQISQASEVGKTAYVSTWINSTDKLYYKINFAQSSAPAVETGADIASITASDVPQPANTAEMAIDGDFTTRWSAEGDQWLLMDLGSLKTIDSVSMAFHSGNQRSNVFTLEVSSDGTNYNVVYDGKTSGVTNDLETYSFGTVWARYVRYTGHGNVDGSGAFVSGWNSPTEIVINEVYTDFEDTIGHWAINDINYLRKYKLVNGISPTLYNPEGTLTVSQFLAMICRACELEEMPYQGNFSDVTADAWYAGYVGASVHNGIIPSQMIADGKLNPEANLTREQMSAIAVNAYEAVRHKEVKMYGLKDKFTDISASTYADSIDKALTLGIVNGMTDTTFSPANNLTRAQAAAIIKRVFVKIYNEVSIQ